ncbi:peroxiredoxin-like family protein [Nocardia mikamii]|uniref:peroxiredoxin-like family protein n=1 Tax=Nocardia mikamii TaxID=508464 RepID=UPI0007A54629|nr:peroxiredoxin-like family protein [Nocardia mikamii]
MSAPTTIASRTLTAVTGEPIPVPDPDRLIHLQFRRFAGCPICHRHLRTFVTRHAEIAAAGIREVAVFHSAATELTDYAADIPFDLIADPHKTLYREFGVESAPRALLHPRAWPGIALAIGSAVGPMARGEQPTPRGTPQGGRLGLPADFLIASDGSLAASHYGTHADDQWTVDELLSHAEELRP